MALRGSEMAGVAPSEGRLADLVACWLLGCGETIASARGRLLTICTASMASAQEWDPRVAFAVPKRRSDLAPSHPSQYVKVTSSHQGKLRPSRLVAGEADRSTGSSALASASLSLAAKMREGRKRPDRAARS